MKGVEEVPFRVLVALTTLALVIGASFGFLSNFLAASTEADFRRDVLALWQSMATLAAAGDPGSFRTAPLTVPARGTLNISVDDDTFTASIGNATFKMTAPVNITQVVTTVVAHNGSVTLGAGRYQLQLYYGNLAVFPTWTIVFK